MKADYLFTLKIQDGNGADVKTIQLEKQEPNFPDFWPSEGALFLFDGPKGEDMDFLVKSAHFSAGKAGLMVIWFNDLILNQDDEGDKDLITFFLTNEEYKQFN